MNEAALPTPPAVASRGARAAALRNMAWLSTDKAVSVALGLLVFGLIARHEGPQGAGRFSYGVAVLQTTLGLSLVCASAAVLPRLCRLPEGAAARAVANVFAVRLWGAVIATLAADAYLGWTVDDPVRRGVALVMVATVPLIEPFQAFSSYWISRNRNAAPVTARISGLVVRLVVVLAALWAGAPPILIALAWLAEAVVTATLQTVFLGGVHPLARLHDAVRRPRMRGYAAFGIRFALGLWLSHLFMRLDRLWLAERMNAHDYGLYATSMQLVEVWLQVATLTAGSMAPAFLYAELRRSKDLAAHRRTIVLLGATGLAGLAGAVLLGPLVLRVVYGPAFADGQPYLVAGFAAAVLFFVDQFVQVAITAGNRPWLLAAKWATACVVALATLAAGVPVLGAFAGPLGLALGVLASWGVVGLVRLGR